MTTKVTAIIPAAGESRRMGQPKLLLPWGGTCVLGAAIEAVQGAGVENVLVITGGTREQIESVCARYAVRAVHNDRFAAGGMLSSIQCGLGALTPHPPSFRDPSPKSFGFGEEWEGILICLGDQPQIQTETVRRIVAAFAETNRPLVMPSYRNRRGHPWLVEQSLWPELMSLAPGRSPRDFLTAHEKDILYVPVENDSILRDLDTPEEYERQKP
jgi:molybdenum cofactor cytidylyltransferase